jgi:hypothetical protein
MIQIEKKVVYRNEMVHIYNTVRMLHTVFKTTCTAVPNNPSVQVYIPTAHILNTFSFLNS